MLDGGILSSLIDLAPSSSALVLDRPCVFGSIGCSSWRIVSSVRIGRDKASARVESFNRRVKGYAYVPAFVLGLTDRYLCYW